MKLSEMKINQVNITDIKPYPQNTKKHDDTQINNVAESIRQYGFVQPLVLDKDNVVIIGHCRLLAAKKLKMEAVPCVYADTLTQEQVDALRIVDNKTNESDWDFDLLPGELEKVDLSMFDFDFGLGSKEFTQEELDSFFQDSEEKEKEPKKVQCPHCGEWFEI